MCKLYSSNHTIYCNRVQNIRHSTSTRLSLYKPWQGECFLNYFKYSIREGLAGVIFTCCKIGLVNSHLSKLGNVSRRVLNSGMKSYISTAVRHFSLCNVDVAKSRPIWELNLVVVHLLSYFLNAEDFTKSLHFFLDIPSKLICSATQVLIMKWDYFCSLTKIGLI